MQNVWGEENVPENALSQKTAFSPLGVHVQLGIGLLWEKNLLIWSEMSFIRDQKINANVFAQSFATTLQVMDVRAENRGRPHQKVRFPAAPVVGRNF